MNEALGLLETTGLTPAMAAIDTMSKAVAVRIVQVELNDLCGVVVKIAGPAAEVQTAMEAGRKAAERMRGSPVCSVLARVSRQAWPAIRSPAEFSPLIQQAVVRDGDSAEESPRAQDADPSQTNSMSQHIPLALGFIETQGFTAVFEAIDTACKAASVEVVGKEKLGGGYVTVVIQGELSAVSSAVEAGSTKVEALGKLVAAHVIARPSEAVLKLLPRL
jgi:microcompartment protein CcmL/EutN